ncbi:MAG: rRNA pseudouridine synthase [Candidatus Omnitrophica bacterium]|nr:rRNA pseudouridine synthase [Candidatus Omnitrophota bacterium]
MRLQVALAKAGIESRRKAAELIASGRVKINGRVIRQKGARVDCSGDIITFDGRPVAIGEEKAYYVLNKPVSTLSTVRDDRGRKTVLDYAKKIRSRVYPVGRLDKDTTGLIVLTNDGELTYRLTHPKFGIERVYVATVAGELSERDAARLKKGITLDGRTARAKRITINKKADGFTELSVSICEGRKREIRKMLDAVGHSVLKLKRIAYGPLRLGDLKEGKSRALTLSETRRLKRSVGL